MRVSGFMAFRTAKTALWSEQESSIQTVAHGDCSCIEDELSFMVSYEKVAVT